MKIKILMEKKKISDDVGKRLSLFVQIRLEEMP